MNIIQTLDDFLVNKGGPIIAGWISMALGFLILHLHLNGFVTPAMTSAAAATIATALIPILIHLFDHNYNNANVNVAAPVQLAVVTPQTAAQSPNAAAPAAVSLPAQPASSATLSVPPSQQTTQQPPAQS